MLGSDEEYSPSLMGLGDKCRGITVQVSITDAGADVCMWGNNIGERLNTSLGQGRLLGRVFLSTVKARA